MEQKEFLQKIKHAVLKIDSKAEVILFGSRARGDFRKDSDWDILVLLHKSGDKIREKNIRDLIFDIELEYSEPISTIIMAKKKWKDIQISPFCSNVNEEGLWL